MTWQRALHKKGWGAPGWPVDHGGPDWTPSQRWIFETECARAGAPNVNVMGVKMVGPVIIGFGSPEQKNFYLPKILSGEDYWCQGYSEPGSGSDLSSLKTRAVRDGDDYIVNGTKIWTTHAHHANRCSRWCAPMRPSAADGISFILIDMEYPGHHDAADPDHRRRPRGQPGVLRRCPRARRQPRRRGSRAGPTEIPLEFERGAASPRPNCATR
jgi:acyl-CoA dehydrogenase